MKVIVLSMAARENVVLMDLSLSGKLEKKSAIQTYTPMYACESENKLYLALREPFGEAESGVIAADCKEGVPRQPAGEPLRCYGRIACHIDYSPDKKYLYTANYRTGSISEFRLNTDGDIEKLNKVIAFPETAPGKIPHAHGIFFTPDGRTLSAPDLGNDCIYLFRMTPDGADPNPTAIRFPEGSGPRHLCWSEYGRLTYLVCQNSSMVYALDWKNEWRILDSASTEPPDDVRNQCSAIRLSPDGKRLYVSNRGANTISIFNTDSSRLTLRRNTPCGNNPRDFAISPDGKWLVLGNMDDDVVAVYAINPEDGTLSLTSEYGFSAPVAVFFPKE